MLEGKVEEEQQEQQEEVSGFWVWVSTVWT